MLSTHISYPLMFCNLMQSTSYERLGKENKKQESLYIHIKGPQRNTYSFSLPSPLLSPSCPHETCPWPSACNIVDSPVEETQT